MKSTAILIMALGITVSHISALAQSTLNATGGNAAGSGGSVSYSVGQLLYSFDSGSNGSAAKGVQQPYEISVITDVETIMYPEMTCTVFPNPSADILIVKIENRETSGMEYKLFDSNGRLIGTGILTGSETSLQMSRYSPGNYILKITEEQKAIRTFKLIKK